MQNLYSLDQYVRRPDDQGLGQLTLTIGKYYRVTGESTQHRGVLPDIVLPTIISLQDHGERSLDNALPWASIEPARYKPVKVVRDTLNAVRDLHEQRILEDPAFRALLATERAIKEARAKKELCHIFYIGEYQTIRPPLCKKNHQ